MTFIGATQVMAQSLEEVDKVLDTSRVTGWDIAPSLTILMVGWPVSVVVARIVKWLFRRVPSTPDYVPSLAARGARILVLVAALALSMSLLDVNVGWFTATLALVAVVAILMLKPLAENAAAGFLLDSRPAFHVGDEIETNRHEGEVIAINSRVTVIRTRDWRRIHIPNTDVLSDAVVVYTTFERRRSAIELDIGYGADIVEATRLLVEAASSVGS
jgi:small conductance mechanosensitive channel